MRLIILGPPGAGKGTQSGRIAAHYGIPAISTGDIFRSNIAAGTELGLQVKHILDAGGYVTDDITNAIVEDRLAQVDCAPGFLLDGYPRTLPQVEALDGMLGVRGEALDRVLELTVDDEVVVRRLLARAAGRGPLGRHRGGHPRADGHLPPGDRPAGEVLCRPRPARPGRRPRRGRRGDRTGSSPPSADRRPGPPVEWPRIAVWSGRHTAIPGHSTGRLRRPVDDSSPAGRGSRSPWVGETGPAATTPPVARVHRGRRGSARGAPTAAAPDRPAPPDSRGALDRGPRRPARAGRPWSSSRCPRMPLFSHVTAARLWGLPLPSRGSPAPERSRRHECRPGGTVSGGAT